MTLTRLLQLIVVESFSIGAKGERSWWDLIPNVSYRLAFSLTLFLVNLLVLTCLLYLSGLIVVGKKRALLSDAFIISLVGTVLSTLFFMFIPFHLIALALSVIIWLLVIKRLYETRWLGAIAVGILAVIIFLAVTLLLALSFGILSYIIERFLYPMIMIL